MLISWDISAAQHVDVFDMSTQLLLRNVGSYFIFSDVLN